MRVYIAGLYGRGAGLSPSQCEHNVKIAVGAARYLLHKGHNVFVPHLFHFIHQGDPNPLAEEVYQTICLDWLECCQAIVMLPNWKESAGAKAELEQAKRLGLKVFYQLDEVE